MTDTSPTSRRRGWSLVSIALIAALALLLPSAALGALASPSPAGNLGFTVTAPPSSPAASPTPSPSAEPPSSKGSGPSSPTTSLPHTGGPSVGWIIAALALIGVGATGVIASRRGRNAHR